MATRYELNARIDATNAASPAIQAVGAEVDKLKRKLEGLENDVTIQVDLDTRKAETDFREFERWAESKGVEVNVDLDTGAATTQLAALTAVGGPAARSMSNLADATDDAGTSMVRAARVLTAGGFLTQIAAIAPAAAAALAAVRPLGGSLAVLGGLGSQVAVGIGLVAATGFRLNRAMEDGEKFTKRLTDQWKELRGQFTGQKSVFDPATRDLAEMSAGMLALINKTMPALGREAKDTMRAMQIAFKSVKIELGTTERNSLNRILESVSEVMFSLTRAAGRVGGALANIFGNRAVVNAAKDLAGWIDKIAGDFLEWTRSEKGIRTINTLVQDARTFWKGLGDAIKPVLDAIGSFDSGDVETLVEALKGIGRLTGGAIRGLENLFDVLGAGQKNAQRATDALNKFGKQHGITFDNIKKHYQDSNKEYDKWEQNQDRGYKNLAGTISKWFKNLGNEYKGNQKQFDAWGDHTEKGYKNLGQMTVKWVVDQGKRFKQWSTEQDRTFDAWAKNTANTVADWVGDTTKKFSDWVSDLVTMMKNDFPGVTDAILGALDDAIGPIDDWVQTVTNTLNKIFDMLGIGGSSGDKKSKSTGRNPNPNASPHNTPGGTASQTPRGDYAGGVYDASGVRYMAGGGFVDTDGVYTALTTGMNLALSQGAVWQAATGGVSDGMVPRVVYGEGHPGAGPKREAYIPEDMEPNRARMALAEAAGWHDMMVVPAYRGGVMLMAGGGLPPKGNQPSQVGSDGVLGYQADEEVASVAQQGAQMWRGLVRAGSDVTVVLRDLAGAMRGYANGNEISLDPEAEAVAAAHEFGHTLGLDHGGDSIMGGAGRVTENDFAALEEYYGITADGGGRRKKGSPDDEREHARARSGSGRRLSGGGGGHGGRGDPERGINLRGLAQGFWMRKNPGAGWPKFMAEGRIYDAGAGEGQYGPTNNSLWDSATLQRAQMIIDRYPVAVNTYENHPPGFPQYAQSSIDNWDYAGRGTPIGYPSPHNEVKGYIESGLAKDLLWTLGEGDAGHTGSERHVHATWKPNGAVGSGNYTGSSIGNTGYSVMDVVQPLIDKIPRPDFGDGPYFEKLASGIYPKVIDAITSFVQEKADESGLLSPGGSSAPPATGSLADWIENGYKYAAAFEANESNFAKTRNLAMEESGGDPNAVNEGYTAGGGHPSGLLQMLPDTFAAYQVSAGDDIFNPVHNTGASLRYQKDRYGYVVEHAPYTRGGLALQPQYATVAEHGPEFFMPLHDPESARRFMSFLENAAIERAEHGALPWQRDVETPNRTGRGPDNQALIREIRALRQQVADGLDLTPETQAGVGVAAAAGTIDRIPNTPQGRDAVRRASASPSSGRGTTGGRISP